MKNVGKPKPLRSADGVNVREGETYYAIKHRGYWHYQIAERVLKRGGETHQVDLRTLKTYTYNDQRLYFTASPKDCFYDREAAVKEVMRRLEELAERCLSERERWRGELPTLAAAEGGEA